MSVAESLPVDSEASDLELEGGGEEEADCVVEVLPHAHHGDVDALGDGDSGAPKNAAPADAKKRKLVVISFDLEVTSSNRYQGDVCQLGARVVVANPEDDKEGLVEKGDADSFNQTLSPKHAFWDKHASAVHGMTMETNRGKPDNVAECFKRFYEWIEQRVLHDGGSDAVCVLVAHNGMSCDFDWLYHVGRKYNVWPGDRVRYVWDTLATVKVASHPFNKEKYTGPVCEDVEYKHLYALENLHRAMFGRGFEGAHDALADATAGARVAAHPAFWSRRL